MESSMAPEETEWHRIEEVPDEGRVFTRIVDGRSVALTRCGGRLGALDNHCPHQGGPLGEGSIENGWLRCPWHGYDYDPTTGTPPEGFSDAPHAFEVREDGDGVYVALPVQTERRRSPTSWSRRWWPGASTPCSAWSVTRISGSPRRCAGLRSGARCGSSASVTKVLPRSLPAGTAS